MLREVLIAGLFVAAATGLAAQDSPARDSIQGQVVDRITGRPVEQARISLFAGQDAVAETNSDAQGRYELRDLEEGLYRVLVEKTGYRPWLQIDVRVVRRKAALVDVNMERLAATTESVTVRAAVGGTDPRDPATSVTYDREQLRRSAGTAGEVLRALDSLPGVTATGEFASFTVRGRGPRDNLILVDGMPFDKVIHFDQSLGEQEDVGGGGRFSVFAPNVIGEATFQPGAWGAAFGGKNGSLLRLDVAEGNRETPTFSGRIDITGLELNYDGPSYFHSGTSLLVSARRLEFDNLFELIDQADIGAPTLTDVIVKTSTQLSDRHSLSVLGIYAPEEFERTVENVLSSETEQDSNTSIGNSDQDSSLLGVTWQALLGRTALLTNTFFYRSSDKNSSVGESFPDQVDGEPTPDNVPVREDILTVGEQETETGWRSDFRFIMEELGTFAAGLRVTRVELDYDIRLSGDWVRYVYDQNDFRPDPDQKFIVLTPAGVNNSFSNQQWRAAGYLEQAFRAGSRWTVTPGLRYDYDGFSGDSLWSPRLFTSVQVKPKTRVTGGLGVFFQFPRFLQLAADPSNAALSNERSTQYVLGFQQILRSDVTLSGEAYYQDLTDLIVIPDQTTGQANNNGDGHSIGVDLSLFKRLTGKWSGGVTYSWAESRRDDNLGEGPYDADFNRPHVFNIFADYEISSRWSVSMKWRFASGRPTDAFIVNDNIFDDPDLLRFSKEITQRNTERLRDFQSLNARVDYRRRFGKVSLIAFIDIFNLYGRDNVDSLEWNERTGLDREQGLSTFPTFGLKFEF